MNYNFNEKSQEYSTKQGKDIPVWQSPKYIESKNKAIEILDSGKYNVKSSDFWILMNETKTGKMAYTGLIISHNGCLKINDALESKFDPCSVFFDKEGFNNSLVFTYCNHEQGIYEVGEVSKTNCKNDYPYAMAFKRLFDRVVLKLSKLAYAGIYSDSESDEFAQQLDAVNEPEPDYGKKDIIPPGPTCECCGNEIFPHNTGKQAFTGKQIAEQTKKTYGKALCWKCAQDAKAAGNS